MKRTYKHKPQEQVQHSLSNSTVPTPLSSPCFRPITSSTSSQQYPNKFLNIHSILQLLFITHTQNYFSKVKKCFCLKFNRSYSHNMIPNLRNLIVTRSTLGYFFLLFPNLLLYCHRNLIVWWFYFYRLRQLLPFYAYFFFLFPLWSQ